MLEITLAGIVGMAVGAGLMAMYCRSHPTGTAAEVAALSRELQNLHGRHIETQRDIWAILGAAHQQLITVDRRREN